MNCSSCAESDEHQVEFYSNKTDFGWTVLRATSDTILCICQSMPYYFLILVFSVPGRCGSRPLVSISLADIDT